MTDPLHWQAGVASINLFELPEYALVTRHGAGTNLGQGMRKAFNRHHDCAGAFLLGDGPSGKESLS